MNVLKFLKSFTYEEPNSFSVGQRLKSNQSKKILIVKREVLISGIKHYSISFEDEPWKKTTLLSESALLDRKYFPLS